MKTLIHQLLFFISASLLVVSCQDNTPLTESKKPYHGTTMMAAKIDSIYKATDFISHPYEFSNRVKLIEQELDSNSSDPSFLMNYGYALLNDGSTVKAIETFEKVLNGLSLNLNDQTKPIFEMLTTAYLRRGEQVNCQLNHVAESCIIPIADNAIHRDKTWSRKAIEHLNELLKVYPNDYQNKWLLNIAYMTLGEYPEKVPEEHFIKIEDKDKVNFPKFKNVAGNLGLDHIQLAGGTVIEDLNNDGYLDVMISSWGMLDPMHYFENDQNGKFVDKTANAGLEGLTGGLNMTHLDYNNDGLKDIYIMRGAWKHTLNLGILPNSLLKNLGNGRFADVTIESGLYAQEPNQASVWADFDLDGNIDLFVGNETVPGKTPFPCRLYKNNQGDFLDIAPSLGMNLTGYVKGVSSGDINNDGYPDLYISFLNNYNVLLLNTTKETGQLSFQNITASAGVGEPKESFPCWFFDYNQDGYEDLFVSSFDLAAFKSQSGEIAKFYNNVEYITDEMRLFKNNGDLTFTNVSQESRLDIPAHTMGCNFGDLNQDGYIDFYLGTGAPDYRAIVPNRMFVNKGGTSFDEVTIQGGFAHIQKGHAIAFGDLDNDGDEDVFANMGGSVSGDVFQNALFENPGFKKNFISIDVEGRDSNKAAIGAKLILKVKDGEKERTIYRTVSTGGSFGSNSLRQEMGIGDATEIVSLQINWPHKNLPVQKWNNLPLNSFIKVVERKQEFELLQLKSFEFAKESGDGHHHHHH